MTFIPINCEASMNRVTLGSAKAICAKGKPIIASHLMIGSSYRIICYFCKTPEDLREFVLKTRGNRYVKGVAYHTCKLAWENYEQR